MAKGGSANTPQEKLRSLFFAVGLAMTQWQQIEQALTQLFVLLIGSERASAASAAFASILAFKSKLGMFDSAAYVVLRDTPLFAEWTSLFNALGRKASKRNEIAHFMLYQEPVVTQPGEPEPDFDSFNREIEWYLHPTGFDGAVLHRYGGSPRTLTTVDIMNRANAFIATSNRIRDFSEKVRALTAPPPPRHPPATSETPG